MKLSMPQLKSLLTCSYRERSIHMVNRFIQFLVLWLSLIFVYLNICDCAILWNNKRAEIFILHDVLNVKSVAHTITK